MSSTARILIVDDEKITLKNLMHAMKKEGYEVVGTNNSANALKYIDEQEFDVVLTDIRMEKVDGMQILKKCRELYPDAAVVMMTGYATIQAATGAIRLGAHDYIAKPFKLDEVRKVIREALERVRLKKENAQLREQIEQYEGKVKIITQDTNMQRILDTARQIAPTDCNVLITGESGTGKELFARYIHFNSKRADGPFFAVNCGAFTEELLTNELFGHEKGAFTGANSMKSGLIEMASGGTLLLDEITEMPPSMQVKLLRVIQEKEVLRLGATKPTSIDVRFVAATNRDIHDEIKTGRFRQDLYFRLNVVSLRVPPLSERKDDIPLLGYYFLKKYAALKDDIPLLGYYFLKKYAALMKKDIKDISQEVIAILMNYDFPGNVRELENIMERGVALTNNENMEVAHLPEDLKELSIRTFRKKEGKIPSLEEQETAYINWVLKEVGGNRTVAAQVLGIDRVSLWRKLKKYGFEE
ncbi:MAG: sigma-54-dependent Fis family transcriptional regulator [Nitrospirae bacterium]|nr:sigma-54-dependent Fis family transcriptional regulator [Nitrospirota bacterium]